MIYVATSWRNTHQPGLVHLLRDEGYAVYDFRHPAPDNDGFHWSEVDPLWRVWTTDEYRRALRHPVAEQGFAYDMGALTACTTCVLVQPCGRSAHLELGWAAGAGKKTIYFIPPGVEEEPDLMVKMADHLCLTVGEVLDALQR